MAKTRNRKVQKSLLNYFSATQEPTQTPDKNENELKKVTVIIESQDSTKAQTPPPVSSDVSKENTPRDSPTFEADQGNESSPVNSDISPAEITNSTSEEPPLETTTEAEHTTETEPRNEPEPMELDDLFDDQDQQDLPVVDTPMLEEEDSEDEPIHRPQKHKKRRIIEEDESTQDVRESEEEDEPVHKTKSRRIIKDEDEDSEDEIQVIKDEDDSEDEDNVLSRRSRKKNRHIILDDEEEETGSAPKEHSTDKDDFREDLDFLDKTDILKERTRGKQVSRYTEALKKLKDKKGKLAQYDSVEKGPIEPYTVVLDSSEEDDSDEDHIPEIFTEMLEAADFIVDDDIIDGEKVTNANTEKAELPPEFSKGRTLSFKRHLETYILYLIELALNPVFDISCSPKYNLAKDAVMRRIQSYRDSIVTSDAWLPPFKEAVDKYSTWRISRPYIHDDFLVCEACRSNKPATIEIVLSSDTIPTTESFYMGSECCRKGELYHQFNHFSSHMYKQVSELVTKAQRKMNSSDRNQSTMIFNKLVYSGDVKKLTNKVKRIFNDVVTVYNIRGQRSRVEFDSSSSSSDDDETD